MTPPKQHNKSSTAGAENKTETSNKTTPVENGSSSVSKTSEIADRILEKRNTEKIAKVAKMNHIKQKIKQKKDKSTIRKERIKQTYKIAQRDLEQREARKRHLKTLDEKIRKKLKSSQLSRPALQQPPQSSSRNPSSKPQQPQPSSSSKSSRQHSSSKSK